MLTEHVAREPQVWLTPCQCSPYYQNTALYPMIELLERVALRFEREESPPQKLSKLEGFLIQHGLPLAETVPLLATLLSLPLTADYAPMAMEPGSRSRRPCKPCSRSCCALRHSSRCSLSWKTCTGSIQRHWNFSPSWSIKAPPPVSWRCGPSA